MIKRFELKKIFSSPIVLSLLVLFSAFNLFIIYQYAPMREDMIRINPIINKYDTLMDKKGQQELKDSYERELASWNKLSKVKTGKTYESAADFFKSDNYYPTIESHVFSKKELDRMVNLMTEQSLLLTANQIEKQYQELDLAKAAETQIKLYGIKGEASETVRKEYQSLERRLEEIKTNQEHLNLFFPGKMFKTHSLIFRTLFGFLIFEALLMVVLITAFLTHYEYDHQTYLVTYSTKRGRRLMWDKLTAALLASIIIAMFLLTITFGTYFLVFDYSHVWKVPISTGFLIEPDNAPFISWWNFSFLEYFLLGCLLILICQIMFTLITYVLSLWIRNSYYVFILFGVLFGAGMLLPAKMPMDSQFIFYTNFTPFSLALGSKKWWMEKGPFVSFQYYEIITVGTWLSLLFIAVGIMLRRFKQENL